MTRSPHAAAMAACHAEGLTVPETAARLGLNQTTIYRWAKRNGLRFANRKVPPPRLTTEQEAGRRKAHRAAMQRVKSAPVNGWTWQDLAALGFTVAEAAQLRGQTVEAAYKAEAALGIRFYRGQIKGLDPVTRRRLSRVIYSYGVSRDTALEIIGRPDLIQPRPDERTRLRARIAAEIRRDPEAALAVMIRKQEAMA